MGGRLPGRETVLQRRVPSTARNCGVGREYLWNDSIFTSKLAIGDLKLFFIWHIIRNQGAAVGQRKGSLMTSQRHFWQSVAAKMSLMQVCIWEQLLLLNKWLILDKKQDTTLIAACGLEISLISPYQIFFKRFSFSFPNFIPTRNRHTSDIKWFEPPTP